MPRASRARSGMVIVDFDLSPLALPCRKTKIFIMSFLRRLVPGYPGRGDGDGEEGEGEALLEHEDYSSSESESSSGSESAIENDYMNGELALAARESDGQSCVCVARCKASYVSALLVYQYEAAGFSPDSS